MLTIVAAVRNSESTSQSECGYSTVQCGVEFMYNRSVMMEIIYNVACNTQFKSYLKIYRVTTMFSYYVVVYMKTLEEDLNSDPLCLSIDQNE